MESYFSDDLYQETGTGRLKSYPNQNRQVFPACFSSLQNLCPTGLEFVFHLTAQDVYVLFAGTGSRGNLFPRQVEA